MCWDWHEFESKQLQAATNRRMQTSHNELPKYNKIVLATLYLAKCIDKSVKTKRNIPWLGFELQMCVVNITHSPVDANTHDYP